LSEVERKETLPALDSLKKISAFFKVPLSLFFNNIHRKNLVGSKIKRLREYKQLSQKELAKKCGLSHSLISQLENGKVHASLNTIRKLTSALGVSVCYVVLGEEEVDELMAAISPDLKELLFEPEVQALVGSICTMDKEKVKLVFNFIEMLNNPKI
jgi:transcriptional regulator with XRE-family HTH domain